MIQVLQWKRTLASRLSQHWLNSLDQTFSIMLTTIFFDHHIGQERDHLTSLLRLVVKRYLNLRLKTYGKKYTEMIAHKNLPSSRHEVLGKRAANTTADRQQYTNTTV